MKLNKLTIENWGPHKHLTCDLNSPIVGIIGSNGKGKSCILQAICYAITGTLPRAKESYIRNYDPENPDCSGKKYKASVTVEFSSGNKDGVIARHIWDSGTSRSLIYDNEVYTKQTEVDAKMEELVGADKAALLNAVFIKQGELTELIKGTPATRQEIFRRLMNLNYLSPRVDDLISKIRTLNTGETDVTGQIEQIATIIKAKKGDIKDYAAIAEKLDIINSLKSKVEAIQSVKEEAAKYNEQCKQLTSTITNDRNRFTVATKDYNGDLDLMAKTLSDMQAELDALTDTIESMGKIKEQYSTIERFKAAKEERDKQLAALKEIPIETISSSISMWNIAAEYANLHKRMKEANASYNDWQLKAHELHEEQEKYTDEVSQTTDKLAKVKQHLEIISNQLSILNGDSEEYTCTHCGSKIRKADVISLYKANSEEAAKAIIQSDISNVKIRIELLEENLTEYTNAYNNAHTDWIEATIKARSTGEKVDDILWQIDNGNFGARFDNFIGLPCLDEWHACKDQYLSNPELIDKKKQELEAEAKRFDSLKHSMMPDLFYGRLEVEAESAQRLIHEITSSMKQHYPMEQYDALRVEKNTLFDKLLNLSNMYKVADTINKSISKLEEQADEANENYCSRLIRIRDDEDEFRDLVKLKLGYSGSSYNELIEKLTEEEIAVNKAVALSEALKAEVGNLEADLKVLQDRQDKNKKILQTKEELQEIRKLISREGLPALYMQNVFLQLTGKIQEFLSYMGANFTVKVDESQPCSFLFVPDEGAPGDGFPQELLSGGQAVRLALALLLASQQIILPEVGLLVLDEPTSHVDAAGVESMRELFMNLAPVLDNSDMQLIIVDHNETLQTGFDKTIKL